MVKEREGQKRASPDQSVSGRVHCSTSVLEGEFGCASRTTGQELWTSLTGKSSDCRSLELGLLLLMAKWHFNKGERESADEPWSVGTKRDAFERSIRLEFGCILLQQNVLSLSLFL
jgi:hypothetical protein